MATFSNEGAEVPELRVFVKKLHPDAKIPSYAHSGPLGDLAGDLFSTCDAELLPGQVLSIGTGIAIEPPSGFGAIVEDRSGMALKGITTLAGVVDTGYRGEIQVVLVNLGPNSYRVSKGDRIAQLRIVQKFEVTFVEAQDIAASPRHNKGFGSTGT
jgi:dUTP pyrophosphatase